VVAHRYELFSALKLLRRGYTLARFEESSRCAIAGWILYWSFPDLAKYELIQPVDNPDGFEGMEYYSISSAGFEFEARLQEWWRGLSPWQRLQLRLLG